MYSQLGAHSLSLICSIAIDLRAVYMRCDDYLARRVHRSWFLLHDYSVMSAKILFKIIPLLVFMPQLVPQLGLYVGGNFNIHIWACSGDFIVRNR